ncbi:hypothetical protein GF325_05425 [Candidatus Bathyarchaeota archaeon]|nr:hypothetical protein [Candidatus Bathyarchaeota archaeon]
MDGQHLVALQQAGNSTLLSEYKKINRNIKHGLEFRFWVEAFIPLAAIVVLTIAQEYIAPYYFEKGFDFGDPSCLDKVDDFLLFVQSWIVGIGALEFFLFDLFSWPDIVHYLVTKRLYYDNSIPVIVESLEEGRELPVGYGRPPDYTRKGDELPGFIETLKMAKKLTDNLKNLPKSVADVQSLKDAAGVAKDVKDIHDDVKEFKDEKVSGKGRIAGINGGSGEILDENIEKIKKLKELLDSGIITQEEFEQKKRELLSRV